MSELDVTTDVPHGTNDQAASQTDVKVDAIKDASILKDSGVEAFKAEPIVETPTYQPNWKYKFAGKDLEVDEMFRSVVKDQETEKKVKDVLQRAMAFDDSKVKWEEKVKTH